MEIMVCDGDATISCYYCSHATILLVGIVHWLIPTSQCVLLLRYTLPMLLLVVYALVVSVLQMCIGLLVSVSATRYCCQVLVYCSCPTTPTTNVLVVVLVLDSLYYGLCTLHSITTCTVAGKVWCCTRREILYAVGDSCWWLASWCTQSMEFVLMHPQYPYTVSLQHSIHTLHPYTTATPILHHAFILHKVKTILLVDRQYRTTRSSGQSCTRQLISILIVSILATSCCSVLTII